MGVCEPKGIPEQSLRDAQSSQTPGTAYSPSPNSAPPILLDRNAPSGFHDGEMTEDVADFGFARRLAQMPAMQVKR